MRRMTVTAMALVAILALVGCSSSKKSSSTAVAAGNSSATTSAAAPTTAKAASSSGGGSSGGGSSGGTFCSDALASQFKQGLAVNPTDPNAMQDLVGRLKGLESHVPSAIRADFTTIVNAYAQLVTILQNDKADPTKLATDLAPFQSQQASLQAAGQHIQAYVTSNCK